jgi:diguanylate cyclase (GGDEF)-like protein
VPIEAADAVRCNGVPTLAARRAREVKGSVVDLDFDSHPSVVHWGGLDAGRRHLLLPGEHAVGRNVEASIRVVSHRASRMHCRLDVDRDGGGVTVTDRGSRNGTWVGDRRIERPTRVGPGDVLEVGGELLRVHAARDFQAALLDHLFDQSARDALTQAWSRRYTLGALARELESLRNETVAIAQIDLDDFKSVNDEHGHEAGDELLVQLTRLATRTLDPRSLFGRVGGDEFLLVLAEGTLAKAREVVEAILATVADATFRLPTKSGGTIEHRQTMAAGITATNRPGTSVAELRTSADRLLYEAKRAGGNRCVAKEDAPPQ